MKKTDTIRYNSYEKDIVQGLEPNEALYFQKQSARMRKNTQQADILRSQEVEINEYISHTSNALSSTLNLSDSFSSQMRNQVLNTKHDLHHLFSLEH